MLLFKKRNFIMTTAKIIIRTQVRANKKDVLTKTINNPFSNVTKVSTLIVELDPHYEAAVNAQRVIENKETDFVAANRVWGKAVGDGTVVHAGKEYVSFIAKEHVLTTYLNGAEIIGKDDIAPFIPTKKEGVRQDVAAPVAYRTVLAENIIAVEIL